MNTDELQRQVETKFAPGPLLAVQALANTYSYEADEELLLDPPTAKRWLLDSGLTRSDVVVDERELAKLVEFRELIRHLIDANLTGEQDRRSNEDLARIAATHPVPVKVSAEGEVALDIDPVSSVDDLIAQMIGIVLQSQADDTFPRLKVCAADDCRWAFYDASRNRGGTWCQMEVCGNREKNRAYRARRAATS
jgi:predicted RNA-binding Zn ribbon-like protein